MPHQVLVALCGRRPEPRLRLVVKVVLPESQPRQLICWLKNIGRGAAREARAVIEVNAFLAFVDHTPTKQPDSGPVFGHLIPKTPGPIYPGETAETNHGRLQNHKADACWLRGYIYALDMLPVRIEEELDLRVHDGVYTFPSADDT